MDIIPVHRVNLLMFFFFFVSAFLFLQDSIHFFDISSKEIN